MTGKQTLRGFITLTAAFLVGALLAGWILYTGYQRKNRLPADTGSVLLAVQKLGDLHTVSYRYKDIVTQNTSKSPNSMFEHIPGVSMLVHWATHNQAVVMAVGHVEAGINLAQVTQNNITCIRSANGDKIMQVHLPQPVIYSPQVHVRVINETSGVFYHDKNIVPRAEATAAHLFREEALNQHILEQAKSNALTQLSSLTHRLGLHNVQFTF